jgi:hypothetical protein
MARPVFFLRTGPLGPHRPMDPISVQTAANWPYTHIFRLRIYYDGLAGGAFTVGHTITGPGPALPTAVIREITIVTGTTGYLDVDTVVGTFANNHHFTDGAVGADVNGTPAIPDWTVTFPKTINMLSIQIRTSGTPGMAVTLDPSKDQGDDPVIYGPFPKTMYGGDVYNIERCQIDSILFEDASQDDTVEVWGHVIPEFGNDYSYVTP